MLRDEIYAGQILWLNHNKNGYVTDQELVRVLRVNPKNIKCESENGTTWTAHPSFLSLADSDDVARFSVAAPGEQLTLGAVVRFKAGSVYSRHSAKYRDLVVIAHKSNGMWSLAPLGGDRGKYFKSIPAGALEVQPVQVVE